MSATNVARAGKRGNICVRNNVSSFARALRDKLSSYEQLLEKANLPTLYNRLQDMCILMCKVKHNLSSRTICNMFYTNSHTFSLRQRDFHLPRFNTVIYLWNI